MILGLDTSRWEDNPSTAQTIDWNTAKAAGVKFLIMKATEGISYTDPVYSLHSQATKGMFLRGSYHFWRVGLPAKAQAAYYFKQAGKLELPPILDVEDWYHEFPTGKTLENKVLEMLREIDYLFGRPCMLYTSPNIIKNYLALQPTSDLLNRKLWIANYGVSVPIIAPWKRYAIWQFSEKGDAKKYGINEALNVDENWYNGTEEEMVAELGGGTELPIEVITTPTEVVVTPPAEPVVTSPVTTTSEYYTFNSVNYWERPGGGPLTLPMTRTPPHLGDNMAKYNWLYMSPQIRRLNPTNAAAASQISAPDWGPSKGLDGSFIKWIGLLWPGRNIVKIDKILSGWGQVTGATLPELAFLSKDNTPHLVHMVYDYNRSNGWGERAKPVYVPIMGTFWVEMAKLNPIKLPKLVKITASPALMVRAKPDPSSAIVDRLANSTSAIITAITISTGGIWGKVDGGWCALRYMGKNLTDWVI